MLSTRGTWALAAITATSVAIGAGKRHLSATLSARQGVDSLRAAEILQQLKSFRMMATVLHVGAHPDDENTQLIAALSRGRAVRAAYLSITRGDGGQNLLGPELGYKLGVARTQELLAARRIDGGRQFFTRALDFGFSKDYLETFSVWDKPEVLGDVVRVIRTFRPDVIITRFSIIPGNTHGHHTGSAVLANEAFRLAGDSTAYPEQLKLLRVWQPKRIFVNSGASGRGIDPNAPMVRMEVGGTDPVTGESLASMASRSRAMHKTQGFGQPGGGGGRGGAQGNSRLESFTLLGGDPATSDILDGVDTTWNRVPGGAEVERRVADVIAKFDRNDPSKSVGALLDLRPVVVKLTDDAVVRDKLAQLDQIIRDCAGISVLTTIPSAEVVPGETLKLTTTFKVSSSLPVTLVRSEYPPEPDEVTPNRPGNGVRATAYVMSWQPILSRDTKLTQPYWLREEATPGMFRVAEIALIGMPENPPPFRITHRMAVDGKEFNVLDEPVEITNDTSPLRHYRRLDVIPPASIGFATDVRVFPLGGTREVNVTVTANRAVPNATLKLDAPAGWSVKPASRSVSLSKPGDKGEYTFTMTAPPTSTSANIAASVTIAGKSWSNERMAIDYTHIPIQPLQPPARFKAVSVEIATRGKTIAYIPGAGDDVPQALEQMGYTVKQIVAKDVTEAALKGIDAVVIGVRASNTNGDLGAAMPALTAFAENGGTVIEQYNQNGGLRNNVLGPYPLTISGDRVTNESATVTFLTPDHPVLNVPNRITAKDFEGWVQERGIYFPNSWDPRYTAVFAMNDAGEAPLNGSLLVAKVGKGYFAYTGLVFFRELPAGVPGAYRLFANLVSLGKPPVIAP